jgi:hypothetical protein
MYADVAALGHFSWLLRKRGWVLVIDVGVKLQIEQARETEQSAKRNDGAARGIAMYSATSLCTFIMSLFIPFYFCLSFLYIFWQISLLYPSFTFILLFFLFPSFAFLFLLPALSVPSLFFSSLFHFTVLHLLKCFRKIAKDGY